ncbi:MAG: hypothetical protein WC836_00240 [Desulfobacula sp.]|jgi:hypothetical protein
MEAKTNEPYIPGIWMFLLTAFTKAIEKAGQQETGAFSQNLVNILDEDDNLKDKIREKPSTAFKVTEVLGSGRLTIIEFIKELTK